MLGSEWRRPWAWWQWDASAPRDENVDETCQLWRLNALRPKERAEVEQYWHEVEERARRGEAAIHDEETGAVLEGEAAFLAHRRSGQSSDARGRDPSEADTHEGGHGRAGASKVPVCKHGGQAPHYAESDMATLVSGD
jgi:hypothetical protein